jgi:uncharacterized protein (DUF362 family)
MAQNTVLINKINCYSYPDSRHNFSPSEKYPEYKFSEISPEKNEIYDAVRNSLYLMGYDKENFGTPLWNPLKNFIRQGDAVLLKPNLVNHLNGDCGMDCVITSPSIIRAVADYALLALSGTGSLVIGDAPIQECDLERLIKEQGIDRIESFYRNQNTLTKIELLDFRNYRSEIRHGIHVPAMNVDSKGVTVDLGKDSEFASLPARRLRNLRVTNYPHDIMRRHHNESKNEYIVAKKMLEADVIINLPKPKTHRFAGVTIALKNFIGINASKECLPHHSVGSVCDNGDEYDEKNLVKKLYSRVVDVRNVYMRNKNVVAARILNLMERILLRIMRPNARGKILFGKWHGNDTIWRTIMDVNKIVYFADKSGRLCDAPQRKVLIIGDMIVSGHEEGPLSPTPKNVGVIAIGENPVCFDEAVCAYMGYDSDKIPAIKNARRMGGKYNFSCAEDTVIKSNVPSLNGKKPSELTADDTEHFTPSSEWVSFLLGKEFPKEEK